MNKIGLNLPNITRDLVKYLMMILITLSSIIVISLHLTMGLTIDTAIHTIMLFSIYIAIFLVIISQDLDKKNRKITGLIDQKSKGITGLIDQKTHVPFTNQIANSEFEFREMVCSAKKSIFIVGPNLHFLAKNAEETKEILFQKFKNYPYFDIRMLLSNPDARLPHDETDGSDTETNGTHAETEIILKFVSECSFGAKKFKNQLSTSIDKFKELQIDFENFKNNNGDIKGNLIFRKNGIITFSLLFIDVDTKNAHVLITPVPWRISGSERPCFLINKQQHESAFSTYYNAYVDLFSEGIEI